MDKRLLYEALKEKEKRIKESSLFNDFFQPNTPLSIEHYPKHYEFFANGAEARQRLLIAGNRVGKTFAAGFEITCHAIGWYPEWWTGRRMKPGKDLLIWAGADTNKNAREVIQEKLLGSIILNNFGTGLIPKKYIEKITRQSGVTDLADTIFINRIGGGTTQIQLKSYLQGRETFQGTEVDIVWLDEEPPLEIYTECLLRLMTTNGLMILTFTPLKGLTELIEMFIDSKDPNKRVTKATWDDVPHLTQQQKDEQLASIPEYQRDARSKGIPQLGSGAIYRVAIEDIEVEGFPIPDHWKKTFGLDVGYNTTAAVWLATNPDNGVTYIYDELHASQQQPHEYARTMKFRGDWIQGVIDPAANNRNQHDGEQIMQLLLAEGLKVSKADNSVEAGIYKVWQMLSTGQLKVFKSCTNVFKEYRVYQRDEKGKVVKKNDHFMDAMRYAIMSGLSLAKSKMDVDKSKQQRQYNNNSGSNGWMG